MASFTSSPSAEELTTDHASIDSVADSGRGSWTSCSSNSHDSFQGLAASSCRPWDHGVHSSGLHHVHPLCLQNPSGPFWQPQLPLPIAETAAVATTPPGWASGEGRAKMHSRKSSSDLSSSQSRQSWASSSSLSDTYEGNYGTIKKRNPSEKPPSSLPSRGGEEGEKEEEEVEEEEEEEAGTHNTDPTYKTVTSSTEKGLIVYCVTSAAKDERYRAPPPTPPGYQGLALGDGPHPRHPHLRPPDYSVALQRSRLLQSPGGGNASPCWSRPASICVPSPELLLDSEDDEQVSAV